MHTRRTCRLRVAIAVLALLAPGAPARALDLFQIMVTNTDGSGVPDLTVGGSSLPNLLNALVSTTGAFASFDGVAFEATVTYAGVPDAITVTFDPAANEATLTFTLLGADAQTFTFSGADLAGQIEQFLRDQLSQQIQAFLNAINTLSLVAVTDGAPMSTTALSATWVWDRFGLHADLTAAERRAQEQQADHRGIRGRIDGYYDRLTTDVGNGHAVALAPSLQYVFSERVSLGLLFPVAYHEIEGARIVNVHGNVAVPVNLLIQGTDAPLGLRVTPFGTLAGSGSVDLIAGGLIGGGGAVATATLELGELTLSASTQLSFHEGITLRYQQWEFDPGVHQTIMKNGIKVTHRIGENAFAYGAITATQFLNPAAVDEYLTPEAGFGWRTANGFSLTAGYRADVADGYNVHTVRLTLQLPF